MSNNSPSVKDLDHKVCNVIAVISDLTGCRDWYSDQAAVDLNWWNYNNEPYYLFIDYRANYEGFFCAEDVLAQTVLDQIRTGVFVTIIRVEDATIVPWTLSVEVNGQRASVQPAYEED